MTKTKIGGQAVMEGVMMRGESGAVALAVRDNYGQIVLETTRGEPRKGVRKIPFLRGIFNLIDSFRDGMGYLTKSAEIWGNDEEEEIDDRKMKLATFFGLVFGFIFAIILFMLLPDAITRILFNGIGGRVGGNSFSEVWASLFSNYLIEASSGMLFLANIVKGVIKITIFALYLYFVARMKEIKRVFMYHGAEHKTINCFEHDMPLTVENVQKCSTYHDRCGTAFMFFVIFVSIFVVSLVEILIRNFTLSIESNALKTLLRLLLRILCLVPVASLSYELLMFNGKHDWAILLPLKWMGRAMQKLSTRQPEDSMVEVAITAFEAAYAMDKDKNIKPVSFTTVGDFKQNALIKLKNANINDEASVDWLICETLKINRNNIDNKRYLTLSQQEELNNKLNRLLSGEPLQYIIGNQQFFDYFFTVNSSVLIPRPETEELTEEVIKRANDKKVLDLMTGSGCIAITVALKTNAEVTASDISSDALKVARSNAENNNASITLIESDVMQHINDKFDIIVSNPPYIPTKDIDKLDSNVRNFEPMLALDGGEDGLKIYRRIAEECPSHLNENGIIMLEVGIGQAEDVCRIFNEKGMKTEIKKDISGIERMIFITFNRE